MKMTTLVKMLLFGGCYISISFFGIIYICQHRTCACMQQPVITIVRPSIGEQSEIRLEKGEQERESGTPPGVEVSPLPWYEPGRPTTARAICKATHSHWQQYLHRKDSGTTSFVGSAKYHVEVTEEVHKPHYVTIIIQEEYYNKKFTNHGGSDFRITSQTASSELPVFRLCSFTDLFNGTYSGRCLISDRCATIEVLLMFYHYDALTFKQDARQSHEPLMKHISKNIYCFPGAVWAMMKGLHPSVALVETPGCQINPMGTTAWIRRPEREPHWKIVVDNCEVKVTKFSSAFSQCLTALTSLTFIGDSSMKMNYFYMLSKMGMLDEIYNLPMTFYKTHSADKGKYTWRPATFISEVILQLKISFIENRFKPGKQIILISSGSAALYKRGFYNYTQEFPSLTKLIKAQLPMNNTRVIWVSNMATSLQSSQNWKNNVLLSVMDRYIKCKLLPLQVEVFNVGFGVTNIRPDQTVCEGHYLCKEQDSSVIYGQVGIEVANALFTYLCQTS